MNSKYLILLLLIIITAAIKGCSQALYIPSIADSQSTGVSVDTLLLGRKLYVTNCGSCHNLYLPERFTRKGWEKVLPEMQKKAKISNQESEVILKYLSVRQGKEK